MLVLLALYNINVDQLVGDRETLLAQRRKRSIIAARGEYEWLLAVKYRDDLLLGSWARAAEVEGIGIDVVKNNIEKPESQSELQIYRDRHTDDFRGDFFLSEHGT